MLFCSPTQRLRPRYSHEKLRWTRDVCACLGYFRCIESEWIGNVLANPDLMTVALSSSVKQHSHLFILSHFSLSLFDTHVLICNPRIYYLLRQETDKGFMSMNTVQLPFYPHTKKWMKNLLSLSLFITVFLWITDPPHPFLHPPNILTVQ